MKFKAEQLEKAKLAKSADELLALARENSVELTEEEAKLHFALWHQEEALADEELDNVNGGSQCKGGKTYSSDPPYELIVTSGNSCPAYARAEGHSGGSTCYTCYFCHPSGLTLYCEFRTIDDDPYR